MFPGLDGITALPVLLRSLELAGCIVTIDAMGCQKKIARENVDADADAASLQKPLTVAQQALS